MTKMKSKKMTKSTFAIVIMAIVMVAMLAFGGTYAYFTATTSAVTKEATTGIVNVTAGEIAGWTTETVVTGTDLATGVQFKNKSNVPVYAIFAFTVKIDNAAASQDLIEYTMDTTNTWTEVTVNDVTYKVAKLAAATNTTDGDTVPVCGKIEFVGSSNSHDGAQGTYMGKTIAVSIQTWAVQQFEVADEEAAVEAALDAVAVVS